MEAIFTSIPAFLFALGIIVFVHEFGHHVVAKLFGVRVRTFSLGFGRRLWGFQHAGTDYRVSLIPLGGYVRMGGELPDEHTGAPGEFLSKPRWQRILIYFAGPAMNVVLSVGLIAVVFMHGIEMQAFQELSAEVGFVEEGSAGAQAGLVPGDVIVSLGGKKVDKWKDVSFIFATSPERPVVVEYLREGELRTTEVTPVKIPRYEFGDAGIGPKVVLRISEVVDDRPASLAGFKSGDEPRAIDGRPISGGRDFVEALEGSAGSEIAIEVRRGEELLILRVTPEADEDGKGKIGVLLGSYRKLPLGEALVESVRYNIEIVEKTGQIIGKLFTREISAKSSLSGPIEIAAISGQAARRGFKELLYTMGFLSISIGLMNLLPIPILDGGHITILMIESIMRRDLSLGVKERVTQVGFMMLMTLMAVVIFFDLAKNLPRFLSGS